MQHRIAVGGIIIDGGRILLVRYANESKGSFLVCPGGRVDGDERMLDAVRREVNEETGLVVEASKLLMFEDIIARRFRMTKSWFRCRVVGGHLERTKAADSEGIIEASWFSRRELDAEMVFPSIVKEADWGQIQDERWQVIFDGTRHGTF